MRRKPLPPGVQPGQPVNDSGCYYAEDGTFMNADGTRSIFDDVDEDGTEDYESAPCEEPLIVAPLTRICPNQRFNLLDDGTGELAPVSAAAWAAAKYHADN